MGFASIEEGSKDGLKHYTLLFDSLNEYEDVEYITFKNDFNDIFPVKGENNVEILMTIDTRNIDTIPLSILYDFSHNLLNIKPRAQGVLKKTYIMVSKTIVKNAFQVIFAICPPISEIEYVL